MELDLWLGGEHVAHTTTQARSGRVRIVYEDWVPEKFEDGTALLSCSLLTPGPSTPNNARAFLEGLLPEGRALEAAVASVRGVRLATGAPESPADSVLLLAEYGRECAGAVVAVPEGANAPTPGRYEPVDEARIAEIIRDLPRRPLGADPDREIRLSLAGAQPKFLLARFDAQWFQPVDGAASTHILKPTTNWPESAQNEALVTALARTVRLTDCASWVETVGGTDILVTSRYDRSIDGRKVTRLHQEDMCQALGMRPTHKYAIGRPSERMARLLRQFTDDPPAQTSELFRQVAFRVLVGDEDGHGKNYSLLVNDGTVRLAPLYDSLCTLVYPQLSGRMAAKIGHQETLTKVDGAALIEEARAMALSERRARDTLGELVDVLDAALDNLDAELVTGRGSERIIGTIRARLDRLQKGQPLGDFAGPRPKRRGQTTMSG
jgi:serine/threonine-protein kinase HipA